MNQDHGRGHNSYPYAALSVEHRADTIRFEIIIIMSIKTTFVCGMMQCTVASGTDVSY
jgi:hypothetical protein